MVCMYVYTIYNQGEDLNLNEGAPGDTNSTLRTTGIYIHMDTVNFSKNVVQKASEWFG